MKNKIFKYIAIASVAVASSACTEIDNYPDGRVTFKEIWTAEHYAGEYLNYAYVPFKSMTWGNGYGTNTFLDSATDNAMDVDDVEGGPMSQWKLGMLSAASNPITRLDKWATYYQTIRMCNILIAQLPTARMEIPQNRTMWIAEAHGLRALCYLFLIKHYGGVPIILDTRINEDGEEVPDMVDDSDYDYSKCTRASFAEVARQIIKDCNYVLDCEELAWRNNDDNNLGRINKGIAAAVMSEAALYSASPLNYDSADPYAIDWAEAATITKAALDGCKSNGYSISTVKPTDAGNANELAANAYDHMFLQKPDAKGNTDKESILYYGQCTVWTNSTVPLSAGHARAGSCPSQELVDCYETIDGKAPILGYTDDSHLTPIINSDATLYSEKNPYANRDPRLRSTIYYNGGFGHMKRESPLISTGEGAAHQISATSTRLTRTGYYLHKYYNITSSRSVSGDGYNRIFRLAELYLNYAEAAAEAGLPASEVLAAVKPVRDRVGMPQWSSDITSDRAKLIERIRNERRVEFAFEDVRFYDVRRWMILDQTAVVTGMRPVEEITTETRLNEQTGELEPVVTRTTVDYKRFSVSTSKAVSDKFLRLPISINEQVALENATGKKFQNPGW